MATVGAEAGAAADAVLAMIGLAGEVSLESALDTGFLGCWACPGGCCPGPWVGSPTARLRMVVTSLHQRNKTKVKEETVHAMHVCFAVRLEPPSKNVKQ